MNALLLLGIPGIVLNKGDDGLANRAAFLANRCTNPINNE